VCGRRGGVLDARETLHGHMPDQRAFARPRRDADRADVSGPRAAAAGYVVFLSCLLLA